MNRFVRWLQSSAAECTVDEAPPPETPDEHVDFYQSQTTQARAVAASADATVDEVRKRADAWGKGALALGSTALTALGIGKLTDYVPDAHWWSASIIVAGIGLATAGLIAVATRLTKVSTPIVMHTRISLMSDLRTRSLGSKSEHQIVEEIYERSAKLNGAKTFHTYAVVATLIEATFTRLNDQLVTADKASNDKTFAAAVIEGIGGVPYLLGKERYTEDERDVAVQTATNYIHFALRDRDRAAAKAALVRSEVAAVAARAQVAVVRQRMVKATTSIGTRVALLLIPTAIVAALVGANAAQALNTTPAERLQIEKACAEIAAARSEHGLTGTLPADCNSPTMESSSPVPAAPTYETARADAMAAALAAYRDCLAANSQPAAQCASILGLLVDVAERR